MWQKTREGVLAKEGAGGSDRCRKNRPEENKHEYVRFPKWQSKIDGT